MDFGNSRFNFYLLGALAALLLCGCQTHKNKTPETVLRVHTEGKDNTTFTRKITIAEDPRIEMRVDESPILTDELVAKAKVVDALGGFALMIKFDPRGQWLLDQYSSLNIGRHLAIFVQFGKEKETKARWIAAPIISSRISDGTLLFTPNTTREEAEQIAIGLNHPKDEDKDKESETDKK